MLETEIDAIINAEPYQRTPNRRDYRNGTYQRDLVTTAGVVEDLAVPRTHNGFHTELFERYQRRQTELDEAICEMFIIAWEDVLENLKDRSLEQVDLWITDGNKAMLNAIEIKFASSKRQRCIKHKLDNVLGYIPEKQQDGVRPELKAIFYQANREKANQELAAFTVKYEKIYPTAVECLKRHIEACLIFYSFPEKH